jgi:hypothetical protein
MVANRWLGLLATAALAALMPGCHHYGNCIPERIAPDSRGRRARLPMSLAEGGLPVERLRAKMQPP